MNRVKARINATAMLGALLMGACAESESPTTTQSSESPIPSPTLAAQKTETNYNFEELSQRLKLPRSKDFPVGKSETFRGKPASPIFTNRRARRYRTVLTEGSQRGPDFAGHFTVVTWGAGLATFSFAVIDARTGNVYFAPFESVGGSTSYGLPIQGGDDGPAYELNSRLFVFFGCPGKESEGCPDWNKDGLYFYSFNQGRFKLERFVKKTDLDTALKE